MSFEWDENKNQRNIDAHHISFAAAALIWDRNVIEFESKQRHLGEVRIVAIGEVGGTEIAVIYTWRGDHRRIISARRARRSERRAYRELHPEESSRG